MQNHKHYFPVLLLSLFAMSSCRNNNDQQAVDSKTIPVIAAQVSVASQAQDLAISGNIEGSKTVKLGFMVAGKISQITVSEGQPVGRNQEVAALDPANYSIAKEIADVQVNQATDEYSRLKAMYERNSISESDFKKIDFTLQGAKAQQKLQTKNLSDTKLYSPIGGVLLRKLAEEGEIVSAGMPVLVVSDISMVKVNAYIPENQLSQVHIGQTASVKIGALNDTVTGKVIEVGSAADATTRAFTVKIEIPNPKLSIRPGMIAEITMPSARQKNVLTIPAPAILHTPEGQAYIFIVDKGRAFQRNISVGNVYGNNVEIISGLSAGETLVVGGQQKLSNGSTVLITKK